MNGLDKALPTAHWTLKMHKTLSGARFIVASEICSTKGFIQISVKK